MIKFIGNIIVLCLVGLLIGGCQAVQSFSPQATATQTSGELLFFDDFSTSNQGWKLWNSEQAVIAYADGGLQFTINQPNYDYWSSPGKAYVDSVLAVEATLKQGPTDNDYGLICRMQDEYNFYAFLISSDGYGGIVKVKDGLYQVLNSTNGLEYGTMIRQDQATNLVRADCVGDQLTLYVNHEQFLQVEDADFSEGTVGLIAGSYSDPGVQILFDNFYVLTP
jgi:hypothetical protein